MYVCVWGGVGINIDSYLLLYLFAKLLTVQSQVWTAH